MLCWWDPATQAAIVRCAQPLVGLMGNTSVADERMFDAINDANPAVSGIRCRLPAFLKLLPAYKLPISRPIRSQLPARESVCSMPGHSPTLWPTKAAKVRLDLYRITHC